MLIFSTNSEVELSQLPNQAKYLELFLEKLIHSDLEGNPVAINLHSKMNLDLDIKNLDQFFYKLIKAAREMDTAVKISNNLNDWSQCAASKSEQKVEKMDLQKKDNPPNKSKWEKRKEREEAESSKPKKVKGETCTFCGRSGHDKKSCKLFRGGNDPHPDGNLENCAWVDSRNGKAFKNKEEFPKEVLPWSFLKEGARWESAPEKEKLQQGGGGGAAPKQPFKRSYQKQGEDDDELMSLSLLNVEKKKSHTIECIIDKNDEKLTVNSLIDTGAIQANYISVEVATWLTSRGAACECDAKCQKKKSAVLSLMSVVSHRAK